MSLLLALTASGGPTYTLIADSGSYSVAGQTANLLFNRVLLADPGSYTLNGQAANLLFNRILAADSGSYIISGQTSNLLFNRVLAADNGSYTLAGQPANLLFNRVLSAAPGAYVIAGQDANLLFNRILVADTGSYLLSGQDATLVYNPASGPTYTLSAESGAYSVVGQSVNFVVASGGHSHDPHRYDFTMDMDVLRKKPKAEEAKEEEQRETVLENSADLIDVSRETDDLIKYAETIQALVDSAVEEYQQIESARQIQQKRIEQKQLDDDEFALILCIAELL